MLHWFQNTYKVNHSIMQLVAMIKAETETESQSDRLEKL
jgi:hypothetical protein